MRLRRPTFWDLITGFAAAAIAAYAAAGALLLTGAPAQTTGELPNLLSPVAVAAAAEVAAGLSATIIF